MTTIVATRKQIVSDSQVTRGDRATTGENIFKFDYKDSEVLMGVAGSYLVGLLFKDYLQGKYETLPNLAEADILMVTKDGIFMVEGNEDGFVWIPMQGDYYAIGSGSDYAIGAMDAGARPEEAVQIACSHDSGSSLPIRSLWIS